MRIGFYVVLDSLEEFVRIDGVGDWIIFFRIMILFVMLMIVVMIFFYVVGYWNVFFSVIIYLCLREFYLFQFVLREIFIMSSIENMIIGILDVLDRFVVIEFIKYAVIVVLIVLIFCIYLFL